MRGCCCKCPCLKVWKEMFGALQLSFHGSCAGLSFLGPGTCDISCGRCTKCPDYNYCKYCTDSPPDSAYTCAQQVRYFTYGSRKFQGYRIAGLLNEVHFPLVLIRHCLFFHSHISFRRAVKQLGGLSVYSETVSIVCPGLALKLECSPSRSGSKVAPVRAFRG